MLAIKNATITDIPLICELTMLIWPPTYNPIIGAKQVAYMLELFYAPDELKRQMEDGHRFIIGYLDEVPVAFASYSEIATGIFKLHKIYILPGQQGKGTGRYMIGHIVKELRAVNANALRLNVNIHNTSAIAFYEKAGFRHFKDEDIDIGGGYFMNDHVLEMAIK